MKKVINILKSKKNISLKLRCTLYYWNIIGTNSENSQIQFERLNSNFLSEAETLHLLSLESAFLSSNKFHFHDQS